MNLRPRAARALAACLLSIAVAVGCTTTGARNRDLGGTRWEATLSQGSRATMDFASNSVANVSYSGTGSPPMDPAYAVAYAPKRRAFGRPEDPVVIQVTKDRGGNKTEAMRYDGVRKGDSMSGTFRWTYDDNGTLTIDVAGTWTAAWQK